MRTSAGTRGSASRLSAIDAQPAARPCRHRAAFALLTLLLAVASWLVFAAPAASAHTVSGSGASNFATTVTGLSPATPGIELAVVDNGARLRLTVADGRTVSVSVNGYENEPYLRLDSTGVWENVRSSAAYLNDDRDGRTTAPPGLVDAAAPPRWELLRHADGDRTIALWHDHRAHWMGELEPPAVRAAPDERHRIYDWTIDLTVDGRPVVARGTLDWVPGPSPLPWFGLALLCGLAVAAAGTGRRWGRSLAAAAVAVVAADVLHAALAAAALAEGTLAGSLAANAVEIAMWLLGLGAAVLLARSSVAGLYLAASAGFVLALAGGLADVSVLYRSSAPVAGPIDLTRAATAVTLGIGLGLVVATGIASRRSRRSRRTTMGETGQPIEAVETAAV